MKRIRLRPNQPNPADEVVTELLLDAVLARHVKQDPALDPASHHFAARLARSGYYHFSK
jgi:hypothetical protein